MPFAASYSFTRLKQVSSGYPKQADPPDRFVLWWIPFHTTWLSRPVVTLRPIVKISFRLKASASSFSTSLPSGLSGRQAVRCVPGKWMSPRLPELIWQSITMVPTSGKPSQWQLLWTVQVILPGGWSPTIMPQMLEQTGHLTQSLLPLSMAKQERWMRWLQGRMITSSSDSLTSSPSKSPTSSNSNWQMLHLVSLGCSPRRLNSKAGKLEQGMTRWVLRHRRSSFCLNSRNRLLIFLYSSCSSLISQVWCSFTLHTPPSTLSEQSCAIASCTSLISSLVGRLLAFAGKGETGGESDLGLMISLDLAERGLEVAGLLLVRDLAMQLYQILWWASLYMVWPLWCVW